MLPIPKFFICLLSFFSFCIVIFGQPNNDWENPQIFEQGKERPHCTFMLFGNEQDVVKDDYSNSP